MNVVCVNYTFDRHLTSPDALLDRYETLVSWAEALKSAGAQVSVVQRFGSNTKVTRNGIAYRFVNDPTLKNGSVLDSAKKVNAAVAAMRPDIVHANGLQFARQALGLKQLLRTIPILLQDHGGQNPLPRHWLNRWTLRRALRQIDAISFVSRDQALPWLEAGYLRHDQTIVELMEGSSHFQLKSQPEARARTGLSGSPLCLWVGRLDPNKDPLTILAGFGKALPSLPGARLAMAFSKAELLPAVRQWLEGNPGVAPHIHLLGHKPHKELEDVYNSADVFLLGSHQEGSGYAVLEALACGVMPVITDIPSFRVLTGRGTVGELWPTGDSDALGRILVLSQSESHWNRRAKVRAFFDENFEWKAIGRKAIGAYERLTGSED